MIQTGNYPAAGVSSGIGTGYAQVVGGTTFDPVRFAENLVTTAEAKRVERQKQEMATRAANAKFMGKLPKPDVVNEHNRSEIETEFNRTEEKLAELQAAGIDLESSPEGRRAMNALMLNLEEQSAKGKAVGDAYQSYYDLATKSPDKYLFEELTAWKEGLDKVKGLENRMDYVEKNQPFKEKLDLFDIVAEMPFEMEQIEQGRTTTTDWNPEVTKGRIQTYMHSMMVTDPEKYDRIYKAGSTPNKEGKVLWSNTDEMVDAITQYKLGMGKKVVSEDELKIGKSGKKEKEGGSGTSYNYSNGTADSGAYSAAVGQDSAFPKYENAANVVTFAQKDSTGQAKDITPMALDLNGQSVMIKPERLRLVTEVKDGKEVIKGWELEGVKVKRTNDGTVSENEEAEVVLLPFNWNKNSSGYANYKAFLNHTGIDLEDLIRNYDKEHNSQGSASSQKGVAANNTAGVKPEM